MREARTELRQCPYCLAEFPDTDMTDDHVIARSWFPAETPPVAKWKVRSCRACNNEKSADDEIRAQAFSGVMEHAKIIQKGPGVEVKIFHAEEPGEFMTLYAFNIWNALKCSASVERAGSS